MLEASIEAAPDDPTETLVRLRDNNESLEIRSRMENQATRLNDLQRQLSRIDKFTALGQVTGRIIHEVGNPLAAIKARIQAAQADPDQYNPADVLADVLRDVRRLESFMDLVTRSRRNPLAVDPANFERLEIGAVLADVHDLLVAEVQQRELDLFVILEPGLPPIAGDSGLLRHLFTNLVRNAIEASEPGTRILLRSERHRRTEAGPFRIRVRVVDQGRGIPAHIENDVWSPFVSSKPDGSGLGLSICRDIVEGHNGSIRLYNHPAGRPGCTASLVFPASPPTLDDSGAAQAQPPPPPG